MTKEELFAPIRECYGELREALKGSDLDRIRQLTLEVHAMVHPAEISGRKEKTIADYVLEYMMDGNRDTLVPREDYDVDLHYAGTRTVPAVLAYIQNRGFGEQYSDGQPESDF